MKRLWSFWLIFALIVGCTPMVCATTADFEMEITSGMVGNIFFDSDTAEFFIKYINKSEGTLPVNVTLTQYSIGIEGNENTISSKRASYRIGSNSYVVDTVEFPVEKYGLYKLNITITDENNSILQTRTLPFSKAVRSKVQNNTIGANVHLTRFGYADELMNLMKNAGFGLARDSFGWDHYEKNVGEYELTDLTVDFLEAAQKNNIKILGSLYTYKNIYDDGEIKSEFLRPTEVEQYKNFMYWFLEQDLVKENISKLEVMNEPDIKTNINGEIIERETWDTPEDTIIANHSKRVNAYVPMVKAISEVVKNLNQEKGTNYKIGVTSMCGLGEKKTKIFADLAYSKLDTEWFDTITLHPYMHGNGVEDPEEGTNGVDRENVSINKLVNYYKYLANGTEKGILSNSAYNFDITEPFWHTEVGYSSADDESKDLCVGDEFYQAALAVRVLNQIKLNSFDDEVYIYEMSNSDLASNEMEKNFGLVNGHTGETPYSAKYGYLAVSNFNSLTGQATSCEQDYENDYSYVVKYNIPSAGRNVYMLWTTKPYETQIGYDFAVDSLYNNVQYYDLLGNRIDEANVMTDGMYKLTRIPFYAVVGNDITRAESDGSAVDLIIKGNTVSGIKGKRVSLVVTNESGGIGNEYSEETVEYINQDITGEDGVFMFTIQKPLAKKVKAFIVDEEGQQLVLTFNMTDVTPTNLKLYSGSTDANEEEFDKLDLGDLTVEVNFGGIDIPLDYRIYCALFDGFALKDVKVFDGIQKNSTGSVRKDIDFSGLRGDCIKIFMHFNDGSLRPICDAYIKK